MFGKVIFLMDGKETEAVLTIDGWQCADQLTAGVLDLRFPVLDYLGPQWGSPGRACVSRAAEYLDGRAVFPRLRPDKGPEPTDY
jgi:hypothetical protein